MYSWLKHDSDFWHMLHKWKPNNNITILKWSIENNM
jgi:hypothetical protein